MCLCVLWCVVVVEETVCLCEGGTVSLCVSIARKVMFVWLGEEEMGVFM